MKIYLKKSKYLLSLPQLILVFLFSVLLINDIEGIVKYDEGRRQIFGIELLQDRVNPNAYYYIPQFPRIAQKEDGSLDILCMKYTGKDGTNGGIFHALVEFSLPDGIIGQLTEQLKEETKNGQAYVAGMVPMMQTVGKEGNQPSRFQVISATLNPNNQEIKNQIITSGFAPLREGSKAAFAVNLDAKQATLLWESFNGPTSDVSISINGYYEAAVKAYEAVIDVEVSTIYEHLSKHKNFAEDNTRRSWRKAVDNLINQRNIDIDIFDRSKTTGANVATEEGIVDLVTDKLLELMFDSETGWSKEPTYEDDDKKYIPNRQKRGFFSKLFGGARNDKYVSDNQFILKDIENIKINRFYLNLTKSTTIKVPVYASGNIGGDFFTNLKDDPKYFRNNVNLDDPSFQWKQVYLNLGTDVVSSFDDFLNSVSINFRKNNSDNNVINIDPVLFNRTNIKDSTMQLMQFPRLGVAESTWQEYEYKVRWGCRNVGTIETDWKRTQQSQIDLEFPAQEKEILLFADFDAATDVQRVIINFFVTLNDKPYIQKVEQLEASEVQPMRTVKIYSDEGAPIAYQVIWIGKRFEQNKEIIPPTVLKDNVVYLTIPE